MDHSNFHTLIKSRFVLLLAGALLAILWTGSHLQASTANSDNSQATGIVESMPANGLIGEWTISGVTYQTTVNSKLEADHGPFVVGACVTVEYTTATTPFTVLEMKTEEGKKCDDSHDTPSPEPSETPDHTVTPDMTETPEPSQTPTPFPTAPPTGEDRELKGIVEQMPDHGLIGTWVIGGVTFVTHPGTRFKQEHGPLIEGACVEVKYFTGTTPFTATQLKTEDEEDCSEGGQPTPTPGAPLATRFDLVDAMPDGLIGEWTIGGTQYVATDATKFKPKHGAFAVGVCVKVQAFTNTSPATIRKLETKQMYRCTTGGSEDDEVEAEGELFGRLQSFPADLIGDWNIGGMTFVADTSTEFKQKHGPFEVDAMVKVHFFIDRNGVNRATKIETKYPKPDEHGNEEEGDSSRGPEGHAIGRVGSFPTDLIGQWIIGGVPYTTTAKTKFDEEDGAFGVGAMVRVEYRVNPAGSRIAHKIETTRDNGGATDPNHSKIFGFVTQMPANGFVGAWTIDNVPFVATQQTQFKEENGLLAIDAYVEIEYFVQNGDNVMTKIETHVPPGAGDQDSSGRLESKGNRSRSGAATGSTWIIDGVAYTVIPATDFDTLGGALTVGAIVEVNSYTAPDGSLVATQIGTLSLNSALYLPTVNR